MDLENPHNPNNQVQLNDGVLWVFDNPNVDVFMTFEVKLTASHLRPIHYSPYQYELWNICKELRDEGYTFPYIANWLNSNGYKTVRGKKFRNPHVHSILKKKRIADERMKKREIVPIRIFVYKILYIYWNCLFEECDIAVRHHFAKSLVIIFFVKPTKIRSRPQGFNQLIGS